MTKTLIEQYAADPNNMRRLQQECAILEITTLIENLMDEQEISRTDLARKLGVSKGWVTQLMDGERNKTVRTLADVVAVLGRSLHFSAGPLEVGTSEADLPFQEIAVPIDWTREGCEAAAWPAVQWSRARTVPQL